MTYPRAVTAVAQGSQLLDHALQELRLAIEILELRDVEDGHGAATPPGVLSGLTALVGALETSSAQLERVRPRLREPLNARNMAGRT